MSYKERLEEDTPQANEPDMSRSYTARDYLEWSFEGLYELIKGKVYKMSPAPSSGHQEISRNLTKAFLRHFDSENSCTFYYAPFDVFLVHPGEDWKETQVIVEPDLCVICDRTKIHQRGCIGSPDFIVEILSPSSSKRDQKDKFTIYQEYSVPEYWIVDPAHRSVTRNILKDGRYEIQRAAVEGEVIAPRSFPGLQMEVEEIFAGIAREPEI